MGYLRGSCFERLALLLICLLHSSYDCCFTKPYVSTEKKELWKKFELQQRGLLAFAFGRKTTKTRLASLLTVQHPLEFLSIYAKKKKRNVQYIPKMHYRFQKAKIVMSTVTSELTNASQLLTDYFSFTYKATLPEQTISFIDTWSH